jgi:gliding motility-associated protein GldM
MIGMMYLVLTAMLALNVSKEILNAFVVVSETVEQTNNNFESKSGTTYAMFAKAAETQPMKAGPPYEKALKVQELSKELVDYVKNIKDELYAAVDGMPVSEVKSLKKTLEQLSAKDNYDKVSNYFIDAKKAYEMSDKFEKYKEQLVKIIDDTAFKIDNKILTSGLETKKMYKKDGVSQDWAKYNFEGTVAAAAFTLLNKTIGEILNMEYETVDYLYKSIDAGDFKFSNVEAKIIPNSRIVFAGDKYEADIIVAAFDAKQTPMVYWASGRDTITDEQAKSGTLTAIEGKDGVVKLSIPTNAVGNQKFAGVIKLVTPEGEKFYSFKNSYMVTKPTAAIAAEKMNVFYAGIPNPVNIAAPVAPENLRINWGGATGVTTAPGKYDVSVPSSLVGRDVTISVSAEMERNQMTSMGNAVFRVKAVPEPQVFVGGNITAGKQPKDAILANPFVSAKMGADFNYQLPWQVVSYKVTFVRNGVEEAPITVNGAQFGGQVEGKVRNAASGTIIEFSDIVINSIAGRRTILKPIVIRVK